MAVAVESKKVRGHYQIIEGSHAASYAAKLARVQVISAYPITPSSGVVEKLADMCASGELGAKFIKVESEHSVMASLIGAAATGARTFTGTSSQGLALMHELLHWVSAARLPVVFVNVNRSMGPPWTVYADQNDSLSQRDTGLMQVYCESNQDLLDMTLISFKVCEKVLMPCLLNIDAFFLSHTSEPVHLPDQEDVDRFLPPYKPAIKLDPKDPHTFGGFGPQPVYYEFRQKIHWAQEQAKQEFKQAAKEYAEFSGRLYDLVEPVQCEDAEIILVASGTAASTARITVEEFRKKGVKLGLLKFLVLRPFPLEDVRRILGPAKKVAVVDRNISYGASGIFYQEIKAGMYHHDLRPPIFGFIAGMGGRDITPKTFAEVIAYTMEHDRPDREIIWIGAKP